MESNLTVTAEADNPPMIGLTLAEVAVAAEKAE